MSLLQMSISAAVMIFIITVIRAIAINRLPKKTFIALWGIVLLRLLVPFTLPSPISVYSLAVRPKAGQTGSTPILNIFPSSTNAAAPAVTVTAGISPWMWVWGIGLALCILYFTIAYIRCRRQFMISRPAENDFTVKWLAEHKCRRPVSFRQTEKITAPPTYGILRPVILMPSQTDWTDTKKLKYVLAHEYVHIRRFDGVTKFLLTAALCIHWFNPLVWVMYVLANRDIELSCDEKVVRLFGETVKSAYALTLIGMEEKKSGLTPLCNHFSRNAIEERIVAIMKIKKTTVFNLAAACAVVAVIGSTFGTSAAAESVTQNLPAIEEDIVTSPDGPYASKFLPDPDIYAKYSSYGISISQDGKRLLYNGQDVRLFADEHSDGEAFYYDEAGTANLAVTRNSSGKITGVDTISEEAAQKYRSAFFGDGANSTAQVNNENEVNAAAQINSKEVAGGTKFEQYSPYGIDYISEVNIMYFKGQRVKVFIDENAGAFNAFWTDEDGTVNLSVVRDSSGQITGIETISEEKVQDYRAAAENYEQDLLNGVEEKIAERYSDK